MANEKQWFVELDDTGWKKHTCPRCGYQKRTDIHVSLGWEYCPMCGERLRGNNDSKVTKSSGIRVTEALDIAWRYSQIDGDWHKAWAIDQMVRVLTGSEEDYKAWVAEYENDGEYEWDVGIAP